MNKTNNILNKLNEEPLSQYLYFKFHKKPIFIYDFNNEITSIFFYNSKLIIDFEDKKIEEKFIKDYNKYLYKRK